MPSANAQSRSQRSSEIHYSILFQVVVCSDFENALCARARAERHLNPEYAIHKATTPLLRIGRRAYGPLAELYPAALLHDDVIAVVGAAALGGREI
jgi:hypothetical protein